MPQPQSPIAFRPSSDLFPFESRFFESSVGPVHYVDEGSGPPILMLHGNPTWSFLYRNVIFGLRGGFRCVAVDYPGFGLSIRPSGYGYTPAEQAGVVRELVEELDLRETIVMGHDWGGPIGLSVATSEPDRVAGLSLGNTWFWAPDRIFRGFSRAMSSPPMQRAILDRNFFVNRILPGGIVRTLSDEEMNHYRGVQPTSEARVGVAELPRQIRMAADWLDTLESRVEQRLGDRRVLITWPMQDRAFPAKRILPRVRAPFSDVRVVELPRARHYFQEDAANEVVRAVVERFGAG